MKVPLNDPSKGIKIKITLHIIPKVSFAVVKISKCKKEGKMTQ